MGLEWADKFRDLVKYCRYNEEVINAFLSYCEVEERILEKKLKKRGGEDQKHKDSTEKQHSKVPKRDKDNQDNRV